MAMGHLAVMWIRIQRYKMKGKVEFNQQSVRVFFVGNDILSSLNIKKRLISKA